MCPTGWAVPTDQGAEYQRDQRNLDLPAGRAPPRDADDGRPRSTTSSRAAAAVAPARSARPSATSRAPSPSSTPAPTAPRTGSPAEGVAPLDRVVWWGPTALDALELGYGTTKVGAALAPINPNFTEPEAAAALETCGRGSSSSTRAPRSRRVRSPSRSAYRVLVTPRVARRRVERATAPRRLERGPVRDLPHQRFHRRVEGRACSRTARPGCAPSRATTRTGRPSGGGEVVMFGLFHMAGWT